MGNYEELKAAVSSVIKTNGNQEITGQVLQNTLTTLISQFGANATFAGIATPTTLPGTPDQNVFYIASVPGNYVNFGNITNKNGELMVLQNSGGNWTYSIIAGVTRGEYSGAYAMGALANGGVYGKDDGKVIANRNCFGIPGRLNPNTGAIESEDTDFNYSAFIRVYAGEKIRLRTHNSSAAKSYMALAAYTNFIDANIVIGSCVVVNAGVGFTITTYTVPAGINYIRVCSSSESTAESNEVGFLHPQWGLRYEIEQKDQLTDQISRTIFDNATTLWINEKFANIGCILSEQDVIGQNKNYCYSDYIRVLPRMPLTITQMNGTVSVAKLSYYDINKVRIGTVVTSANAFDVIVPDDAYFVRFCYMWNVNNVTTVCRIRIAANILSQLELINNKFDIFPFATNGVVRGKTFFDLSKWVKDLEITYYGDTVPMKIGYIGNLDPNGLRLGLLLSGSKTRLFDFNYTDIADTYGVIEKWNTQYNIRVRVVFNFNNPGTGIDMTNLTGGADIDKRAFNGGNGLIKQIDAMQMRVIRKPDLFRLNMTASNANESRWQYITLCGNNPIAKPTTVDGVRVFATIPLGSNVEIYKVNGLNKKDFKFGGTGILVGTYTIDATNYQANKYKGVEFTFDKSIIAEPGDYFYIQIEGTAAISFLQVYSSATGSGGWYLYNATKMPETANEWSSGFGSPFIEIKTRNEFGFNVGVDAEHRITNGYVPYKPIDTKEFPYTKSRSLTWRFNGYRSIIDRNFIANKIKVPMWLTSAGDVIQYKLVLFANPTSVSLGSVQDLTDLVDGVDFSNTINQQTTIRLKKPVQFYKGSVIGFVLQTGSTSTVYGALVANTDAETLAGKLQFIYSQTEAQESWTATLSVAATDNNYTPQFEYILDERPEIQIAEQWQPRHTNIISNTKDFDIVDAGATANGMGYNVVNQTNTHIIQLRHPVETYLEHRKLAIAVHVNAAPTSGDIRFEVGSNDTTDQFGHSILRITGQTFQLIQLHSGVETVKFTDTLTDITIEAGGNYVLGFQKETDYIDYFIYDGTNTYTKRCNKKGDGVSWEMLALGWGYGYFSALNGDFWVKDCSFSSPYFPICKIALHGDSFVEGATMVQYGLENRYCALLEQAIGAGNMAIYGKGGEAFREFWFNQFVKENDWFRAPYVFFALGTNNNSLGNYLPYAQQAINVCKQNGQTPVLVTITPRPTVSEANLTAMNDWIRNSGEKYVDMNLAVTVPGNQYQWRDGYVLGDLVHPSVAGHKAMFERITIDLPELLNV